MTIQPSDPRLTAFVLGELSESEAAEIQTAIEQNSELKAEAAAIRQIADQIQTAMNEEPLPGKDGSNQSRNLKVANKRWFIPAAITAVAAALIVAVALPLLQDGNQRLACKPAISEIGADETIARSDSKGLTDPQALREALHAEFLAFGRSTRAVAPVVQSADSPSLALGEVTYYSYSAEGSPPLPRPLLKQSEESERSSEDSKRLLLRDSYNNERNEAYKNFTENEFKPVKLGEFSTFSIDVDTAAYSTMRRYVADMNQRPPVMSVRLEEYINYFRYDYAQPTDGKPFATHVDVFTCPWESKHLLARVGIKGKEYSVDTRPPLNLVFLVDSSGSMEPANRLPLVKQGLTELVEMLQPKDRVAIVTYAGESRLVLPSVSGQEKRAILDSITSLGAGGSTNGAGGIKMAYEIARKYFNKEAQNRVILCTDGDFNVGTTDNKTLEEMIGDEAKSGVFLTILGFGMGNYKDDRLKTLSMRGNGNYGYIDSLDECRRLLVEGLTGTLFAIAKDVKIQVDFNPAKVAGYRLLGYENRKLRDEDFHNDAVDAGEIGAGHTVTALYEIVPIGIKLPATVDKSRYDTPQRAVSEGGTLPELAGSESDELMFVKLRYKEPDGDKSSLLEYPVKAPPRAEGAGAGGVSPPVNGDSQFASAVALYGMLLRSSQYSGNGSWNMVLELAVPNVKEDKYRQEFVELVKKARELR